MPVNVGLLGLGNIGTGTAEYLRKYGDALGLYLKAVAVRDVTKQREINFPTITDDAYRIIRNPDVQIVVELIGGENPALEYVIEAIDRGKAVVTANKLIIAKYGPQIFGAARRRSVDIGFEASVGGGIPIVQTLREDLVANKINRIIGILNGTTNYILTRMSEEMRYEDALRIAQERGFAEADPYLDVSGGDAKQKLAILASLAWNTWINPDSIPCEGITEITPQDIDYAADFGYTVKLLAVANRHDSNVEVRVNPALIRVSHPLASVRDEFNAIYLEGDLCGSQMYYGKGAGRNATTSAVISDITRIARNISRGVHDSLPSLTGSLQLVKNPLSGGYVRVNLKHVPGTLGRVASVLGRNNVNIKNSIQLDRFGYEHDGEIVIPDIITTEPIQDSAIRKALEELAQLEGVLGKPFYLRIEE